MRESELHNAFSAWLRKHSIPFYHCRTDKRATIDVGMPDFAVFSKSKVAFVEFKMFGNKLSSAQEARKAELERAGCQVCVARDLETAVHHLATIFEGGISHEMELPPPVPSEPKFYLVKSPKIGIVVVIGRGKDMTIVRAATPRDVETIPFRPMR